MSLERCGGLWFKEGKTGTFLTGPIKILGKEIQLFLFEKPRNQLDNPDHPDYAIFYKQEEQEQKAQMEAPKFVPGTLVKY